MKLSIGRTLPLVQILLFCVCVAAQGDDVISVDASIVVVNAAITDGSGKAVTGLERRQFRLFEDGVEQPIDVFEAEDAPFAAVILIDTSGSMEERISLARAAAIQFLHGLRPQDQAAIYSFDSEVELVQDFSSGRDLPDRFYDLRSEGMTVLNDAVYKAAAVLSTQAAKRRAIIVLSDGADTMSKRSSDKALQAAVAAGCTVYTVDMSSTSDNSRQRGQNKAVLKSFAEKTGGRFVETPGGRSMRDAFAAIVAELGVQYTLAYSPLNSKRDGKWRNIEVRVARSGLTIRARKGYSAPKPR